MFNFLICFVFVYKIKIIDLIIVLRNCFNSEDIDIFVLRYREEMIE